MEIYFNIVVNFFYIFFYNKHKSKKMSHMIFICEFAFFSQYSLNCIE